MRMLRSGSRLHLQLYELYFIITRTIECPICNQTSCTSYVFDAKHVHDWRSHLQLRNKPTGEMSVLPLLMRSMWRLLWQPSMRLTICLRSLH